MLKNYNNIIQLINLWQEYESASDYADFLGFSQWLADEMKNKPATNKKQPFEKPEAGQSLFEGYIKGLDDKSRFFEYISRMARMQEFYVRKFLHGTVLNSRLEFVFLKTIKLMGKAKKTELINLHIVEYTTGMDTIRRLTANGLIEEKQHENDKRAKTLFLTQEGYMTLEKANKNLNAERNMFLAGTAENKWKKAMPLLKEINEFHYGIYLKHGDKPYPELLNLIGSLKHLHK